MLYSYWRMFGENRYYVADTKRGTASWSEKPGFRYKLILGGDEPYEQTKEEAAFEAAFKTPKEAWAALESVISVFGIEPAKSKDSYIM